MCELFAMSSLYPATVSISLEEFSAHGGLTAPHKDGWGIAFYEENDVRIIREPNAAADSACLEFIRDHHLVSPLVLSHIRLATQGVKTLHNTQPFCRELGGRMHVFAHNGDLHDLQQLPDFRMDRCLPLGDTDSEFAFCYLMSLMQKIWKGTNVPSFNARTEVFTKFVQTIRDLGQANILYSDSEILFVHGHKRRQSEDQEIKAPGLHVLCRTCDPKKESLPIEGLDLRFSAEKQKVILVSSVPLTSEEWIPLTEGEIVAIAQGKIIG